MDARGSEYPGPALARLAGMNPSTTIEPQSSEFSTAVTQLWKRFLETYEPLFCAAFNARDLDRLTALLLDQATVEVVGASTIYGATSARGTVLTGILFGSKRMAAPADGGRGAGNDPRFAQGVLPESAARAALPPRRAPAAVVVRPPRRRVCPRGFHRRAVRRARPAVPDQRHLPRAGRHVRLP